MEKTSERITEGELNYIEQVYMNGHFELSGLYIKKDTGRTRQDFYGIVPESLLGKNVYLFEHFEEGKFKWNKGKLFQKLTYHDQEKDLTFQIRAVSLKDFF